MCSRWREATVVGARRLVSGSNIRWEVSVSPDSNGDVTITLPATTDCDAQGAICADGDKKLSNRLERTVSGPGGVVPSPASTTTSQYERLREQARPCRLQSKVVA